MRTTVTMIAALIAASCSNYRPSVLPSAQRIEKDPGARMDQAERADANRTVEHTPSLGPKLSKLEKTFATVAAVAATVLTGSSTAAVGVAADFEENELFEKPVSDPSEKLIDEKAEPAEKPTVFGPSIAD